MISEPLVGVIIINWNGRHDTVECLESFARVDYSNYIIILVDNASTDGLAEVVEDMLSNIVLLKNKENLGFCGGNNVGIRYALSRGCSYILLLNNDTIVEPSFLSKLVDIGEKHPEIGMLSPFIYWHTPFDKIWFYGAKIRWEDGCADHKEAPEQIQIQDLPEYIDDSAYLSGCALLAKASVIRKIGVLDTRFFAYYEDVDWCVRCQKAGWKLAIVPSAKIWHKVASSVDLKHAMFFCYRNTILFLWKYSYLLPFFLRVKRHIYKALAEFSWDRDTYFSTPKLTNLDGVWSGLTGNYGEKCVKMPEWARKLVHSYIRYLLWVFRYPK